MARPPCSERERDEAERVAAALREAGYAAHVQSSDSRGPTEPWLAGYAGLSAVAALLAYPLPLVAAVLGIVAIVLHARDSDGRPLLSRRSCTGSNVMALGRHAPLPDVVLVAPLTDRVERLRPGARRAVSLCLQALMVAAAGGGAVAWVAEAETELPRVVAPAGVAVALGLVACVLVLYRPPGEDGRTSVAAQVLLSAAPLIADRRVWLIAAGSDDAVRALLDAHCDDLAGCAWLNLEAGAEGPAAVSEEGRWRERRADRWLLDTAEEAGARVRTHRAPTHATPLLARRRRALTLLVDGGADDLRILLATVDAAARSR